MEKSGNLSGMLARVLPILAYDRNIARLTYERLPKYAFPLKGLLKALQIMEAKFHTSGSTDNEPILKLQFSQSAIDKTYRKTNELLVASFREQAETDYRGIYRTLLDNGPPGNNELRQEGSGCGLLTIFLDQVIAEFTPLVTSPADKTFLRGLEENILRIASDFYWAYKITSYLSPTGVLENEEDFKTDLQKMIDDKVVTIPDNIVSQLLSLVKYILKGVFLLNNLATGVGLEVANVQQIPNGARKRHRVVDRLSQGTGNPKRRKFFISRLDKAIGEISSEEIVQQIGIFKAQAVVTTPTHRTLALERNLSNNALEYLKQNCEFDDTQIVQLVHANGQLMN